MGQSGNRNISFERYYKMSRALNETGRQILYSMCQWGQDQPYDWAYQIANSWRATGDVFDAFDRADVRCPCTEKEGADCDWPGFHCSIMNIINKMVWTIQRSQPGGWNDLDMLEVGNGGMSDDEYKLHMTMWAAMKSPLIMGTDIRSMDAPTYSIYTNPAIIALNQDPLGAPVIRKWRYYVPGGEIQMHSGNLASNDWVVVLLNAASEEMHMNATAADIFWDNGGSKSMEAQSSWDMYDLWANRMPDSVADQILKANSTVGVANVDNYLYNSTAMSYTDGIMANHTLLMGTKVCRQFINRIWNYLLTRLQVGTFGAQGTLKSIVPPHGVMAYRLRPAGAPLRKRDEL